MPKIKSNRRPPPGFAGEVESVLEGIGERMRAVGEGSADGKRKNEAAWTIFRLHNQRTRYVYDLYHKRKAISKEVYDYCIAEKYADASLIAKWKKPGYEKLCCLRCIQPKDTNFGTTCVCRVPRKDLADPSEPIECVHCGCRGCASGS